MRANYEQSLAIFYVTSKKRIWFSCYIFSVNLKYYENNKYYYLNKIIKKTYVLYKQSKASEALITLREILNTSVDFDEHTNTMAKEEYIAICMEI